MQIDFTGRRVLITASTGGIGLAAAEGFLRAGASVVINGRNVHGIEGAVARLLPFGPGRVEAFGGDLSTAEACDRLVTRHPQFDILINNLGVYGPGDFFEMPDSEWDRYFQTNVMSGVRLARAYAPGMVEKGWGRIVFVSSESALNIPADMPAYGFTKTAQLAISRGLAKRLAGTGVTVNAVLPGPTLSAGVERLLKSAAVDPRRDVADLASEFIAEHRSSSLIRRAAAVTEVANMILYVSSAQASATTGAALRVDGGIIDSLV